MNNKSKNIGYYYEKFRAFLLVFLMLLCIVQVGILWSSQSGSFPVSFLSSLFYNTKTETRGIEESKGNYLLPYRVVVSTGYNQDHYIIPNGSSDYTALWSGAKDYLSKALDLKPKNTQVFSEEKWATIVANKPYTFEFKTQIPIDIIKWVLDLNKISAGEGIAGIYKVAISPDDPDNSYLDTLFIRDDKNIYTYELPGFEDDALNKVKEEFKRVYSKQQESTNSKNYEMAKEKYGSQIKITQDLLGPLAKKSTESYANITCLPFASLDGQTYSITEYNSIAKDLFGQDKSDYDPDVDINGAAVFKKADSVYRLHNNSVLEYRYIRNQGNTEKAKVLDAYKNAIGFIMEHSTQSNFMKGISIYLKSIEEKPNSYIFNFDYSISLGDEKGEVPILMQNYKLPKTDKKLNSSISIEASSKRVVYGEWILLKLELDKNFKSYEWSFADMHAGVFEAFEELKNTEISAKDFGIYYVISYPTTIDKAITPSFVLYTNDGNYNIPMKGNIN